MSFITGDIVVGDPQGSDETAMSLYILDRYWDGYWTAKHAVTGTSWNLLENGIRKATYGEVDSLVEYFHTTNEGLTGKDIAEDVVRILQTPLHPLSQRFHELLAEAGDLHDKKQKDYGSDADPFANVRATTDWGMPSWVGAMVRATDKVKRLQTFARKGELANESVVDAFMDLAVYALIARILYEEESSGS